MYEQGLTTGKVLILSCETKRHNYSIYKQRCVYKRVCHIPFLVCLQEQCFKSIQDC